MPESPLHKSRDPLPPPTSVAYSAYAYAELCVHSNFSFLRGASHPDELVYSAALLGYRALAITDVNTLAGVVRAHVAAKKCGLKLIVGARLTLLDGPDLIVWPTDRAAYGRLSKLITYGKRDVEKTAFAITLHDFLAHSDGMLVAVDVCASDRGAKPALPIAECRLPIEQTSHDGTYGPLSPSERVRVRGAHDHSDAHAATDDASLSHLERAGVRENNGGAWQAHPSPLQGEGRVRVEAPDQIEASPSQTETPHATEHSHASTLTLPAAYRGAPPSPCPGKGFPRLTTQRTDTPSLRLADTPLLAPRTHLEGDGEPADPPSADAFAAIPPELLALKGRLWLAVGQFYDVDNASHLARMIALSQRTGIPLVATNHVHYHDPGRRMLQDVLVAIRHNCTLDEAGHRLFKNGERYLKPPDMMHRLFADYPKAIEATLEIASRVHFSLDELKYEYPDEIVPPGHTPASYLTQLAWDGARDRYPDGVPPKVHAAIEHELKLIAQLNYEPYFLTVYDLVKYARSQGILCQGRGSAANSAVCYCIGVTSVDPARIDLLFERFISAARNEPPDIDVDFEHERREEVIQYVYRKYGRRRAGMTATLITYRGRSAVREVGKALGLSLDMVDSMAKRLDWWHRGALTDQQLRESGCDPTDPNIRKLIALTADLLGFPRHLGQHTGGMVMTRGELCELVPIENASMPDRTVIEWDKDDIDELGLLKVDVLALGMLTAISKAFRFLNEAPSAPLSPRERDGVRENAGRDLSQSIADANSEGSTLTQPSPCPGEGLLGSLSRRERDGVRENGGGAWQAQSGVTSHDEGSDLRSHTADARPHPNLLPGGEGAGSPSRPRRLELHTIPPEDSSVYDMICDADTVGVFQIESRAQMSMLPRLKPRKFYDLVIEVAIVRPGPIQGNMVHPYLRRRNGEEQVSYPSEALRDVLHKTLGVPLFQEQAMKIAMVAAGFSAEEADQLRRAMAAWRRSARLLEFQDKIVNGMLRNGYTREFADQCFDQIKGFGEYGFPESHSASFALLVYASCWLKRYHPAAFCAALLNSQPMGFYAPAQLVRDAREHGVEVRPVDVNASDWDCTLELAERHEGTEAQRHEGGPLSPRERVRVRGAHDHSAAHTTTVPDSLSPRERVGVRENGGCNPSQVEAADNSDGSTLTQPSPCPGEGSQTADSIGNRQSAIGNPKSTWGLHGPAVRLGFRLIKGLRQADIDRLVAARNRLPDRRFTSIEQVQREAKLSKRLVEKLAEADAFGSLGRTRRPALWEAMALDDVQRPLFEMRNAERGMRNESDGERISETVPSWADDQQETVGDSSFTISHSPFGIPPMPLGQEVLTDYNTAGLSLKTHPVALVRETLAKQKITRAVELPETPAGKWVRVCGLVLIRQRPGTASGIVFVTLEDETGVVNLIVRPRVFDRYRPAARHAALLQCEGYVEKQGQVIHVMAKRLFDRSDLLAGVSFYSRDFH